MAASSVTGAIAEGTRGDSSTIGAGAGARGALCLKHTARRPCVSEAPQQQVLRAGLRRRSAELRGAAQII
ncbi:hypothetical protein NDU88_005869 [Pleurodeles waltl]|uniref:Uncharacterized protein n=1 Tax=Pleurodeles waltl TaxID=8319 RepID=A0AAV7L645_PLEWA|nr:hypothetical protein NDU88_005869 [Pleurodeles waltl]